MLLCSFYLKYNSSLVFSVQILLKVEYWNYFLLLYFYVFLPSHALLILNIYMLQIFFLLYILGFKIIFLIQIETFIETEFIWFGLMLLWMFLCFTDTHLSQFFSWIMQFNNCCPKGIIQFLLVLWEFCTIYFNHIYSPTTIPPRSILYLLIHFHPLLFLKIPTKTIFFLVHLLLDVWLSIEAWSTYQETYHKTKLTLPFQESLAPTIGVNLHIHLSSPCCHLVWIKEGSSKRYRYDSTYRNQQMKSTS